MKHTQAASQKKRLLKMLKSMLWFLVGVLLGFFLLISFAFISFKNMYALKIYPGVWIDGVDFGGKTESEILSYFSQKNKAAANKLFIFQDQKYTATISAEQLQLGFDGDLLAKQAYSIGRSGDVPSNIYLVFQAYINSIVLPPSYRFDETKLEEILLPIKQSVSHDPIDALFTFDSGRVVAFRPSENGQALDVQKISKEVSSNIPRLLQQRQAQVMTIPLYTKILRPRVTTDQANSLGIKELVGSGTSLFQHSIPSRIFNISLSASRMNGILVAPQEEFSFDKTLGDVSAFTGYKQGYIIQNGRTVLGDGGGVCQVSTTLFRALLNAGLRITERNAHAYRPVYYEQDSLPGLDATIYVPSVDLKFKNDTVNYILIQSVVDQQENRITFYLYGAKDGREVALTKPIISQETPPPPPLYQDDPTLPKGVVKQIDFSAYGANVQFTRTVKKNGKVMFIDKFVSNYRPWQAVYLRGTKE